MYDSITMVESASSVDSAAMIIRSSATSRTMWVSRLAAPCRGFTTTGNWTASTSASMAAGEGRPGTAMQVGTGSPPSRRAARCATLSSSRADTLPS